MLTYYTIGFAYCQHVSANLVGYPGWQRAARNAGNAFQPARLVTARGRNDRQKPRRNLRQKADPIRAILCYNRNSRSWAVSLAKQAYEITYGDKSIA